MEREGRRLDQERHREEQEDPLLRPLWQRVARELGDVERQVVAGLARRQHAERHGAREHQQRADQRVDHELGRRRDARAVSYTHLTLPTTPYV